MFESPAGRRTVLEGADCRRHQGTSSILGPTHKMPNPVTANPPAKRLFPEWPVGAALPQLTALTSVNPERCSKKIPEDLLQQRLVQELRLGPHLCIAQASSCCWPRTTPQVARDLKDSHGTVLKTLDSGRVSPEWGVSPERVVREHLLWCLSKMYVPEP